MKKIIQEQKTPQEELDKLMIMQQRLIKDPVLGNRPIEEINYGNPVTFKDKKDGKVYTFYKGISTINGNFIVSTGNVLVPKTRTFMENSDGKRIRIEVPDSLEPIYSEFLKKLGIDRNETPYQLEQKLKSITTEFQSLIDQGARGNVFGDFEMLRKTLYPGTWTGFSANTENNPLYLQNPDSNDINFKEQTGKYNITYYVPLMSNIGTQKTPVSKLTAEGCRSDLLNYLAAVVANYKDYSISLSDKINNVQKCFGDGFYDKPFKLTSEDLNKEGIKMRTGVGPLDRKFLFKDWEVDSLTYKDVLKYIRKLEGKKEGVNYGYSTLSSDLNESKIHKQNILLEIDSHTLKRKLERKDDVKLSKIIKSKLNEEFERKKKTISEQEIIRGRLLNVIGENVEISRLSKKQKEILSRRFISEINLLHQKNLINEGFLEFVKGIFGGIFPGLIDTIVEPYVDSLLKGLGLGGYWKNFFVSVFTSNPMTLINAFKSCDAMTKLVSESLIEGMVMNLQEKTGTEGTTGIAIRNILGQALKKQAFIDGLSESLRDPVCDLYDNFTDKAKDVLDKLKSDKKEENLTPQLQN